MKKYGLIGRFLRVGLLRTLLCAGSLALYSSCDDYDDSWIREETENLKDRVAALEEWQKSVNGDIQSLRDVVAAMENNDYVTDVKPLADGTGYVISFAKNGDITIRNGEKGDTPAISARQDTDGTYYWTVDGEWLLDDEGEKMPVVGTGKDAIAPQVRINASTNEWEISTDGGKTWTSTGVNATGPEGPSGSTGDGFFQSVTVEEGQVVFTLKDGTRFTVPKAGDQPTVHVAAAGGLEQALTDAGIEAASVKGLTITGTLGDADFTFMKDNLSSLNRLDISGTDITVLPEYAFEMMPFESVILPEKLKEIKNSAFYGCTFLRSLDIPESVETLGRWIVEKCDYLETITLHNGLATLSESTFYGCGITSIRIPGTVTEIPNYCFSDCKKLQQVYLHDGIESIGVEAFFNCESLQSFTAPAMLTELSDDLFYNCQSLRSVVLHNDITSIGFECFVDCISLREIQSPDDDGSLTWKFPNALATLGEYAFHRSGLERVSMAKTKLKEIPNHAFDQCKNLSSISAPAELEEIGELAFYQTAIPGVELPATIKELKGQVFSGCKNMTMLTCKATTAPSIQNNTFPEEFKTACTLYYPQGATGYDSWEDYFSRTVEKNQ